jgi:tRNA pseudouridine65 synthase
LDATEFAVQIVRDYIGKQVFPVHRLDRKTAGVLLFALDSKTNSLMQQQFAQNRIEKKYLAIVRGFTADSGEINYPLINENGHEQQALTLFKTLARAEIDLPFLQHNTSRYSLVEITPKTGRMHQIRKHFAHIMHPIIGDRPHGCNKQNKLFKEKFEMMTMLLLARELSFIHPVKQAKMVITAKPGAEFLRIAEMMGWNCDSIASGDAIAKSFE